MGDWSPQTGAPVPEVYNLLQRAITATTFEDLLRLSLEADEKLDQVEVNVVDGYEMDDSVRFAALALHFICGPAE